MRLARSALALAVAVAAGCGSSSPPPAQPIGPKPDYPEVAPEEMSARLEPGDPWTPSDKVRQEMHDENIDIAHLAPRFCVDETGAVVWAEMTQPSEFPPLDDDLLADVRAWKFQPGAAACTTLQIEYEQK